MRSRLLSLLRVPPEPRVPEGTAGSVLTFRAGRNFYRWQVLMWAVSRLSIVIGTVYAYYFTWRFVALGPPWVQLTFVALEILSVLGMAFGVAITYLALRWEYEMRWYIVTDRSLRIRRGVWNVEELTMTFANIQEIRITSGPIQNLLGLADVQVHSAGGGSVDKQGERHPHVASFEGVDNATTIRDLLVERLRVFRESGLGGEPPEPLADRESHGTLSALTAVLEEARALRKTWQGTPV